MRTTGDKPVVSYDDNQYFCINSLNLILPRETYPSLHYLLAVLNSSLLAFYYQALVQEEKKTFAEVKIAHMKDLPIRRIGFVTPKDERARLLEESKRLYFEALAKLGMEADNQSTNDTLPTKNQSAGGGAG